LDPKRRKSIYVTALAGVFLIVVDTTAAFIAVPSIAAEFGVALPVAQWVVVGYLLIITVCLVPFGRISDLLGRKSMYVGGWVITSLGALGVVFSPTVAVLVLGRFTMGLGAALVQATSMAIVVEAFGASERGRVLGVQMGVVGVGTVMGPVFGGVVIGALGWRAIYLIVGVTSVILALVAQRVFVRRAQPVRVPLSAMDPQGMLLLVALLILLLGAATATPNLGLGSPWVAGGFGLAGLVTVLFIIHERRSHTPMLDLDLFRSATVSLGLVSGVAVFMATASVYFLIPFYAQTVLGLSPTEVGILLVPGGIVTAVAAPLMGYTSDRFGHRRVSLAGQVILAAATAGIASIHAGQSVFLLTLLLMSVSLGLATFHAPNNASIFATVNTDQFGVTSALINLARNMGNVVGIATVTGVVTATMAARGYPPSLAQVSSASDAGLLSGFVDGMQLGFWILSGLALAVAALHVVILLTQKK
jgi:MFS family permease